MPNSRYSGPLPTIARQQKAEHVSGARLDHASHGSTSGCPGVTAQTGGSAQTQCGRLAAQAA